MPAPRPVICLLAAALALPVAACGSSDENLLRTNASERFLRNLDAAQNAIDNDNCPQAAEIAREAAARVTRIDYLDDELQSNLLSGFNRLSNQANSGCQGAEEEETPTPTPTPTPTATVEETPVPTPTPTATEEPTVSPEPTETVVPEETVTPEGGAVAPEDDPEDGGVTAP